MAMDKKTQADEKKQKKADKTGFYAALAICVLAIGIAAWSTYDTMSDFLSPADDSAAVSAPETSVLPSAAEDPETNTTSGHGHGTAPSAVVKTEPEAEPEASVTEEVPEHVPVVREPAAAETAAEPAAYTESESWLRPVASGEILTAYSDIPVYSETMRDYRVHYGADYAAQRGETVKAVANGIVKKAYTDMLYGNILVIEHGSMEVRYCGLGETFLVDPGEVVRAGQDIGSVTAAPCESAMQPHLHMEVIENGTAVDPETCFN